MVLVQAVLIIKKNNNRKMEKEGRNDNNTFSDSEKMKAFMNFFAKSQEALRGITFEKFLDIQKEKPDDQKSKE